MQTKNINVEPQVPMNNSPQKVLVMVQNPSTSVQAIDFTRIQDTEFVHQRNAIATMLLQQQQQDIPALPPRSRSILFTPIQNLSPIISNYHNPAEVEGYGPYKPVPPPKPLSTSTPTSNNSCVTTLCGSTTTTTSYTPPPYRMPPYPLYNEPGNIPGSTTTPTNGGALPNGLMDSTPNGLMSQGFQTHSNKFPIEREVILSNGDKNSKIPILHDYKKRTKAAIAPDIPPKQLGAWTTTQLNNENQNYSVPQNHIQSNGLPEQQYRQQFPQYQDPSTGAVPKNGQWTQPKPQQTTVTIETPVPPKQSKAMTKTYQTIRGMISSRFTKTGTKEGELEKQGEVEGGLNNGELRRSNRSMEEGEGERLQSILKKPPAGEPGIYGKPYNQQMMYQGYQMLPGRSQDQLRVIQQQDQLYYQQLQQQQFQQQQQRIALLRQQQYIEPPRSAQQLERDNIRQRSFMESRRAASQPHLASEEPQTPQTNGTNPDQFNRSGSYGDIMETFNAKPVQTVSMESDDGGFIKSSDSSHNVDHSTPSESKTDLTGTPKLRLETEIGKIEGVYNLAQRLDRIELDPTEDKSSSNADSGRGSAAYSSGRRQLTDDTSPAESSDNQKIVQNGYPQNQRNGGQESEWVDIVENELRHILDQPKQMANSTLSESISSMTPPLPPLSPGGSTPNVTPRNSARYKHTSLPYGSKPDYGMDVYNKSAKLSVGPSMGGNSSRWQGSSKSRTNSKKHESKSKHYLADITSTTTRSVDMESMFDGQTDSDGDLSTTDARTIRKQLEGLETMYSEVLKLLGVKKQMGRYQPSDPRYSKRRYGSMSSLPSSSVSSRPIRDKRARAHEERKKVKDLRGINKRFQRLESHVVTLARSVAHLSSEMRTQHLMIQEMENIREEISALRQQTTIVASRTQSIPRGLNATVNDMPSLANPSRVKKLTKFFGDEPPLLRLFLKSLGYEKYANAFENERVGMVELPYLSEERLQKIGIPLGPRLRILQEAQISVCKDTTLCIV